MLNLDFEMRAVEGMAQEWEPENQEDEERQQIADQYVDMNRKLRQSIGELFIGIETVLDKTKNKTIRNGSRSDVSHDDPELREKEAILRQMQATIMKQ